jgi:hypothetical protein
MLRSLPVSPLPSQALAFTNNVYLPPALFAELLPFSGEADEYVHAYGIMVSINGVLFNVRPLKSAEEGTLAMNSMQRRAANITMNQTVECAVFRPPPPADTFVLSAISLELDLLTNKKAAAAAPIPLDCPALTRTVQEVFVNQPFQVGQTFIIDFGGKSLSTRVVAMTPVTVTTTSSERVLRGQLSRVTEIVWSKGPHAGASIQLQGLESAYVASPAVHTQMRRRPRRL